MCALNISVKKHFSIILGGLKIWWGGKVRCYSARPWLQEIFKILNAAWWVYSRSHWMAILCTTNAAQCWRLRGGKTFKKNPILYKNFYKPCVPPSPHYNLVEIKFSGIIYHPSLTTWNLINEQLHNLKIKRW